MFEINKSLRKILNEKKGITSNSTKTVDYIKFLIFECISVSNPYKSRPMDLSLNYRPFVEDRNVKYDEERQCVIFDYRFSFPKTATMTWMSDNSDLFIRCIRYNTEKNMLNDPGYKGSATSGSIIDSTNNKTKIGMQFVICFAAYTDTYYVGGYKFDICDDSNLISVIQHEINHVNKRTTYNITDEYISNYNALIDILTNKKYIIYKNLSEKNLIITIAEMIYRYCVKTEREAFTEQFYKQWSAKFSAEGGFVSDVLHKQNNKHETFSDKEREEIAKTTKIYSEYLTLKKFLRNNYYNLIERETSKILYENFKDLARYFLNLKYKKYNIDYVSWCKEFIRRIEYNMELFKNRCMRATHINDSKTILITEQIENYLRLQY